jgi:mannose-6-phosphate isomerase-like protein (cupin superfamily)
LGFAILGQKQYPSVPKAFGIHYWASARAEVFQIPQQRQAFFVGGNFFRNIKKNTMIQQANIQEKFDKIEQYWTPKNIGELNGQLVKLAKIKDELVWHSHADEDEMFLIFKGTLIMEFRDKTTTTKEGEMLIIPKGVEHLPKTNGEEVWIMLIEPMATKLTGEVEHEKTVKNLEWI